MIAIFYLQISFLTCHLIHTRRLFNSYFTPQRIESSLELVGNSVVVKMRRTHVTAVMPSAQVAAQYTNQDQVQTDRLQFTSGAVEEFGDFVTIAKMVCRTYPLKLTFSHTNAAYAAFSKCICYVYSVSKMVTYPMYFC